jgi:hypothetical protein
MTVIFVGIHNKPDLMPLCNSTRSGKLIQRIINRIPEFEVQKTNLFDTDYFPAFEDMEALAKDWYYRVEYDLNKDIVILLGATVHERFVDIGFDKILKYAHPSSKRSIVDKDRYVTQIVRDIKEMGLWNVTEAQRIALKQIFGQKVVSKLNCGIHINVIKSLYEKEMIQTIDVKDCEFWELTKKGLEVIKQK